MSTRNLVLGSAMLLPLLIAKPAQAQRVSADIVIGGGPVAGRVIIGDRNRPRRIRGIEWVRSYDYDRDDWWGRFERGSRIVVVYWDPYDDSYYLDRYPGLEEIRLFERDGRYYRLEENRYGGRVYDRYDPRWNVRLQYRNNGRDDGRYDGRNNGWGNDRRNDRRDDRADNRRDNRRDNRQDARRDDRRDDRQDARRDDRRDNRKDDRSSRPRRPGENQQ